MPLPDQRHTVRLPLPDMIVRGRAHTIEAPVWLNGALVTPSSWSVAVYNASNESAKTGTGGAVAASLAIASGDLSSQALGESWRVEWAITLSGGTVLYPRNDAMLVRNGLWPVITDSDLERRVPALDTAGDHPVTTESTYQDFIDEAWLEIQLRLIRLGQRPYLVMEPSALRTVHLYLSLALLFEDMATRLNSWDGRSMQYRDQYERAWSELNPKYDSTDSGQADTRRRAVQPTVWLCGGRNGRVR